jgi:hypothetical protein
MHISTQLQKHTYITCSTATLPARHKNFWRSVYEVWSKTNARGKITWDKLERFHKNKCIEDSYSLSDSFRGQVTPISRLASRAGPTTNHLIYHHPNLSKIWRSRVFSAPHSPGLQKVCRNITVGRRCIWGQDPVSHSNKLYHQSW